MAGRSGVEDGRGKDEADYGREREGRTDSPCPLRPLILVTKVNGARSFSRTYVTIPYELSLRNALPTRNFLRSRPFFRDSTSRFYSSRSSFHPVFSFEKRERERYGDKDR